MTSQLFKESHPNQREVFRSKKDHYGVCCNVNQATPNNIHSYIHSYDCVFFFLSFFVFFSAPVFPFYRGKLGKRNLLAFQDHGVLQTCHGQLSCNNWKEIRPDNNSRKTKPKQKQTCSNTSSSSSSVSDSVSDSSKQYASPASLSTSHSGSSFSSSTPGQSQQSVPSSHMDSEPSTNKHSDKIEQEDLELKRPTGKRQQNQ